MVLARLAMCASLAVVLFQVGRVQAADSVPLPFGGGQAARVIQGYNGGTHQGRSRYALDLVLASGATSGAPVVSPVAGAVAWAQAPGAGTGCLAIAFQGGNYSVVLCHLLLDHPLRTGEPLGLGQSIGTVGPAGAVGNNGTPHVHLELHRGGQGSNPVPFSAEGGLTLAGTDLPASGAANEHMARVLGTAAVSPGPASAPPAPAVPARVISPRPPSTVPVPAAPAVPAPAISPRSASTAPAPALAPAPPSEAAPGPEASRQQAASVAPAPARPARAAIVEGTGACLKVRDQPGLEAAVVDCVWDGTEVALGDGVEHTDALTWRRVRGLGWVADEFLRRTRAVISGTGSCLNVRDAPSTLGAVLTCLPEGTSVALGESVSGDFGAWVRITRAADAGPGWVLDGFLS